MQPSPLWQLLPPQQACPTAPQVSQVPAPAPGSLQPRPVLQVLFAQQVCPEPPHGLQIAAPPSTFVHVSDAWHWLAAPPWQQAAPEVPHTMQVPAVQRVPLAVQNCAAPPPPPSLPPQQAWSTPPQGAPVVLVHDPAEQVPLTPLALHAWFAPTHMRVVPPPASVPSGMQHPFAVHVLPAQQGWPGVPQAATVDVPPAPPDPSTPPAPPKPRTPPAPPRLATPPVPPMIPPLPPSPAPSLPPLGKLLLLQPARSRTASPTPTPTSKTL
jgi:hypothetical protein